MPKPGVFSGREVRAILEAEGFKFIRQRGSHMVLQKADGLTTVTVPVPNHAEIRIGTLLSIIRQSRISREKFLR